MTSGLFDEITINPEDKCDDFFPSDVLVVSRDLGLGRGIPTS
jgi:hypothetical protein